MASVAEFEHVANRLHTPQSIKETRRWLFARTSEQVRETGGIPGASNISLWETDF
jgi:hypothetical protein